jgi:hypothetical protein
LIVSLGFSEDKLLHKIDKQDWDDNHEELQLGMKDLSVVTEVF